MLSQKFELGLDPNDPDYDDDGVEDSADHFPTDDRLAESIPVRYYGAIDLSEGLANFPLVQQVALDDANQVAFVGWADLYSAESVRVAVWRDGAIVEDFGSPTNDFIPAFLNATGTLLGLMQAPEEPYAAYRAGLLTSAGVSTFELPALYYYTVPGDPYNGRRIFLDSVFLTGFSQAGEVFCDVSGILWEPRGASFYGTAGNWQADSLTVRAVSAQGVVAGWSGIGSGVRVNGATSYLAWLPGAALAPRSYAVNDQAQIVGLSGADDAAGYPLGFYSSVGTGGRTIQSFPDLLPAKYRQQLRSAIPYLITNADATTGKPTIVFGAESLEGESSGDWITRTLALEWQAGVGGQPAQPFVRVVDVLRPQPLDGSPDAPPNISPSVINSAGLMAQAGPITIAGQQIKVPLFERVEVEVRKNRNLLAQTPSGPEWLPYQQTDFQGLRISTLANSFLPMTGANITPHADWIQRDADQFRIKANLPGETGKGTVSAWISTKNPPNPLGADWDDDPTEIELQESPANSGIFYSSLQLLVADDVDDDQPAPLIYEGQSGTPALIADDVKNDPTHKIALGGWVYMKLPGMAVAGALAPVPVERVVRVEPVILRTNASGNPAPVVAVNTIRDLDLKKACERMATAGIKLEFPTKPGPNGPTVDVVIPPSTIPGVSEDGKIEEPYPSGSAVIVPPEPAALFSALPSTSSIAVRVYFAADLTKTVAGGQVFSGGKGVATPRSLTTTAQKVFANNVLIGIAGRTQWTLAHELMHVLMDCDHSKYGFHSGTDSVWLWSETNGSGTFKDTKRIRHQSEINLNQRGALRSSKLGLPPQAQ